MFITNEHTRLTAEGKEAVEIKPNIAFSDIPAGYKVWSYATIKNMNGEVVAILQPGSITYSLKETPKVEPKIDLSIKELKEMATEKGISFPAKVTKAKLMELLDVGV